MIKLRFFGAIAAAALAFSVPVKADKTAGEVVDDSTITAGVKAALLDNRYTSATDINVEAYKGVVQLSGFVETDESRKKAAKVAGQIEGVKEVRNSISVHPDTSVGTKLDDSLLTAKVKTALIEALGGKANQINVESKGGIVQLAGFVDSGDIKKQAAEIASKTKGAKKVEDVLIVK